MSEDRVLMARDGAVAHVTLNRPDKRNGLDLPMFDAILAAGESLAKDPTVRAVVLDAAGPSFCAGLDWKAFMSDPDASRRLLHRPDGKPANLAQQVAWVWQEVPVPVICAIQGQAFGGGLQLAMGADLRYATPGAELSVMEIRWGLIPDMGITQTLARTVPTDVLKELTWTGRRVGAEEALRLGLITRIDSDPLKLARETASAIAGRSPDAIRAGKQLLRDAPGKGVSESFLFETELQLPLLGSKNQMEAVMANFQKRDPVFSDPQ
ncbi:MAG: crotonase/enoyl-CoA hydratase family protein [Sandaracinaceae bacterium]